MRSNSANSATKRSTKRSKSRLPLVLTAIVAVFALGSVADGAQRVTATSATTGYARCWPQPRDLGPKGIDPQFAAGLVDAYRAILSLKPATTGDRGQSRSGVEPVIA